MAELSGQDHSLAFRRGSSAGNRADVAVRLNELLAQAGEQALNPELAGRFHQYLDLLMRWNARLNLTGIRDIEGILSRHFVESMICARAIPEGVHSLLDFGSGAGFPGIPIALLRPDIAVTLAESQAKKAAFLREVLRTIGLGAEVYAQRAETLDARFDCVAMRAVDRMQKAVAAGAGLVRAQGWLVLMSTGRELPALQASAGCEIEWKRTIRLPQTEDGLIMLGIKVR